MTISLTKDILTNHIYSNLSGRDLLSCLQVCGSWRTAGTDDCLWKIVCMRELFLSEKQTETWKQQYLTFRRPVSQIDQVQLFANAPGQKKTLLGHLNTVNGIVLDGDFLASSESRYGQCSTIYVWDLQKQIAVKQLKVDNIDPDNFSLREGRVAFLKKGSRSIHYWNCCSTVFSSSPDTISEFNIKLIKGDLIETKASSGFHLLDWPLSKSLPDLPASKKIAHAWLQGNFLAITRFDEHTITVMSAQTHETLAVLQGHKHYIQDISLQGNILVSGSQDGTVKVWNCFTRECLLTIQGEGDERELNFVHVRVSLEGYLVAFAAQGKTSVVEIWDWHAKRCLHVLTETSGLNVLFYKNSVVSSHGNNIHIWEFKKQQSLLKGFQEKAKQFLPFLSKK